MRTIWILVVALLAWAPLQADAAAELAGEPASESRLTLFVLSASEFAAVEGGVTAYITVQRVGSNATAQAVDFATADSTAVAGTDYASISGTLSFQPGEFLKDFTVDLVDDALIESDRVFQVEISNPTGGAVLGIPAVAPVHVVDDDDPRRVGRWGPVLEWPLVAVHLHMLPTGKVMVSPGSDEGGKSGDNAHLWDPADLSIVPLPEVGYDFFCAGHCFAADGRLLVTGGHLDGNTGLSHASFFDPFSSSWTNLPDMVAGRWYPTNTALANGEVLVLAGAITPAEMNCTPEVWSSELDAWRSLTGAILCEPSLGRYYPFLYQAPNGKVFCAGWQGQSYYLDTAGSGAWSSVATTNHGYRDYGTSALYDDGKVLITGGTFPGPSNPPKFLPTASTEVIDLSDASPAWRSVSPAKFPRRHHTATILPDGTLLAVNGTGSPGFNVALGAVRAGELWDPQTEEWSVLAPMDIVRVYHSTAVLLPDARVLVAGGGQGPPAGGIDNYDAQIYSPPYLFQGPRPIIDSAPVEVVFGETFFVTTPSAFQTSAVNWVRLSSVTHGFNQNQRINRLAFQPAPNGLNVTAPADGNVCPPGHYLLFLLDQAGVPSVAKILRIDAAAVGVPEVVPSRASFARNYPNPVRSSTVIEFGFPRSGRAVVQIFDVKGRLVRSLSGEDFPTGAGAVEWDGRNEKGRAVAPGTYVYRVMVDDQEVAGKAVVVR